MQRLFSMFPQGGPGVALLLLRVSVAGITVFRLWTHYGALGPYWVLLGVVVLALALCVGVLTPILSVLICLVAVFSIVQGHSEVPVDVSTILNAIALALLGPGAYSLDAWLYGRRVVVVPARERSSKDR
jgi:uncharacterized membrane protein YphA (DoxX/SURF4 family)